MQQFTIPQFIDVEDKIIGPITTRQFILLLVEAVFIAIFYKISDFALFIFLTVISLIICITFAFVKVNSRPFHFFVLNLAQTISRPSLRVWNYTFRKIEIEREQDMAGTKLIKESNLPAAKNITSRLAELSLIVDTQGAYKGEAKGSNIILDSSKSANI